MASVNKVILIGNLGRDPVAPTDPWKDKTSGEKQEKTEWHRVTFYRRLAEIVGEYLKKGSQVYIEGRLETRKWQDKEGKDRYTTEIIANEMKMLGSRAGQGDASGRERDSEARAPAPAGEGKPAAAAKDKPAGQVSDMGDELPF